MFHGMALLLTAAKWSGCGQRVEEGEAGSGGQEVEAGGWEMWAGVGPSHQTTAGAWPRVWGRIGPELFHKREGGNE